MYTCQLTNGQEVFETKQVKDQSEWIKLNHEAKQATDGNMFWTIDRLDHIKIEGHKGYWYEIDRQKHGETNYCLMEHETYGDEAACIIITEKTHKIILEDCWNGWLDLEEAQ
jgi:hypothetical protein